MSFQENSQRYDQWFDANNQIYRSELRAIQSFIPTGLNGLEVGMGTGRFAEPLGIRTGIEPSAAMAQIATARGLDVWQGVAEALPCTDNSFDFVLMVTAICFFSNVPQALSEARRVIKPGGFIVVSIIDKDSPLGQKYQKNKEKSDFYKDATFYSVAELTELLHNAGFRDPEYNQTVFSSENILHELKDGYGEGSFVTVKAYK